MLKKTAFTKIIGCLVAIVFLFSMAACGKSNAPVAQTSPSTDSPTAATTNDPTPKPTDTVTTVKFLHIWPEMQQQMDEAIQKFEDENPQIKIETSVVPWDKVTAQLQVDVAAGDAPDVAFMWPQSMSNFVNLGAALDLTPYLDADNGAWKNQFISNNVLAAGTYDGKVYAVPFRGTTTVVAYNKDLFEQNGWSEPTTLEDFEKMCDEMLAKGITPFAIFGNPEGGQVLELAKLFYSYEANAAGILDDPQYKTMHMEINGPFAAGFKKVRDWYDKGYFGKNAMALKDTEADAEFFTGKYAMLLCNNNRLPDLRKLSEGKFNLGFLSIPKSSAAKETLALGGFDGFFVNGKTKVPDQAVALLKALTSTEIQQIFATEQLNAVVAKGVTYNDPDLQKIAASLASTGRLNESPDFNYGNLFSDQGNSFVEFMLKPGMTPEQLEAKWNDLRQKAIQDSGSN